MCASTSHKPGMYVNKFIMNYHRPVCTCNAPGIVYTYAEQTDPGIHKSLRNGVVVMHRHILVCLSYRKCPHQNNNHPHHHLTNEPSPPPPLLLPRPSSSSLEEPSGNSSNTNSIPEHRLPAHNTVDGQ